MLDRERVNHRDGRDTEIKSDMTRMLSSKGLSSKVLLCRRYTHRKAKAMRAHKTTRASKTFHRSLKYAPGCKTTPKSTT